MFQSVGAAVVKARPPKCEVLFYCFFETFFKIRKALDYGGKDDGGPMDLVEIYSWGLSAYQANRSPSW